jgi:hypothetical protein
VRASLLPSRDKAEFIFLARNGKPPHELTAGTFMNATHPHRACFIVTHLPNISWLCHGRFCARECNEIERSRLFTLTTGVTSFDERERLDDRASRRDEALGMICERFSKSA